VDRHGDPELAVRLRRQALGRLAERFPFLAQSFGDDDPIVIARACERVLKAQDFDSLRLPEVAPRP
jgi:hypothetical protein